MYEIPYFSQSWTTWSIIVVKGGMMNAVHPKTLFYMYFRYVLLNLTPKKNK